MRIARITHALALIGSSAIVFGSSLAFGAPIKVACFGDPSTHSDQLQAAQEYPAKLQQLLGNGYDVRNFGDCCGTVLRRSRYTNTHGSHAFIEPGYELEKSIAFQPDIVVVGGVGKHDLDETGGFGPGNTIVAAEFEEDYEILVKKYLDLPTPPRVFVSTPVPYPKGSMALADAKPFTTIVLPAVRKTAAAHGLLVIDLYGAFYGKPELFKDDVHLSNVDGLQKEADVVYGALQKVLVADGGTLLEADAPRDAPTSSDAEARAEVPSIGNGAGGTGGGGGENRSAGSATGGTAAPVADAEADSPSPSSSRLDPNDDSGCSLGPGRSRPATVFLALLGAVALLWRRRPRSAGAASARRAEQHSHLQRREDAVVETNIVE